MDIPSLSEVLNKCWADHALRDDAPILVAFSGGADSMALAHALTQVHNASLIWLVYCNHQLRSPQEIETDLAMLDFAAAHWGVHTATVTLDVTTFHTESAHSLESAARKLRYDALIDFAVTHDIRVVLTAHHLDDQCETMLFRLIRGARIGVKGIQATRPLSDTVTVYRPFLQVAKTAILKHKAEHQLPCSTDSTNADPAFTRNHIRHSLMPQIAAVNPNYRQALSGFSTWLSDIENLLDSLIAPLRTEVLTPDGLHISTCSWDTVPPVVISHLIRKLILTAYGPDYPITEAHIQAIQQLIHSTETKQLPLPDHRHCVISGSELRFWTTVPVLKPFALTVSELPGQVTIPETQCVLRIDIRDTRPADFSGYPNILWLDAEALSLPLIVRNRQAGDRFQPLGFSRTVSLKKFLINRKIPRLDRAHLPVLACASGIIAIAGLAICEAARITENTKRFLRLDYSR